MKFTPLENIHFLTEWIIKDGKLSSTILISLCDTALYNTLLIVYNDEKNYNDLWE